MQRIGVVLIVIGVLVAVWSTARVPGWGFGAVVVAPFLIVAGWALLSAAGWKLSTAPRERRRY